MDAENVPQIVHRIDGDVGLPRSPESLVRVDQTVRSIEQIAVDDGRRPRAPRTRELVAPSVGSDREPIGHPRVSSRIGLHHADPARPAERRERGRERRLRPGTNLSHMTVAEHPDRRGCRGQVHQVDHRIERTGGDLVEARWTERLGSTSVWKRSKTTACEPPGTSEVPEVANQIGGRHDASQ